MVKLYIGKSHIFAPLKSPKLEFPWADFGGFWICCSAHFYLIFGTKKPCVAISSRFSGFFFITVLDYIAIYTILYSPLISDACVTLYKLFKLTLLVYVNDS